MTKTTSVTQDELAELMNDLEAMLAAADAGGSSPAPAVVVPPTPVAPPPVEPPAVEEEPPVAVEEPPALGEPEPLILQPEPAPEPEETKSVASEIQKLTNSTIAVAPILAPAPAAYVGPTVKCAAGLDHYVDISQFQRDIAISESNMDQAMMQQAGMRAYYGSLAGMAEAQYNRVKATFEVIEAKLYDEHKRAAAASGDKTTDKAIDAAVKMDPRWLAAKNKVIEAGSIAEVNKGLTFAMADRREMLIQLGNDRRAERSGELRILNGVQQVNDLANRARAAGKSAIQ